MQSAELSSALAVLAITAAVIFAWPTFWPVVVSNSLIAIAGDVFGPAVAALTLGLYARKQLAGAWGAIRPSTMPATSPSPGGGRGRLRLFPTRRFSPGAGLLRSPGIAVLSIPADAIDMTGARLEPRSESQPTPPRPPAKASCSNPGRWPSSAVRHAVPFRQCAALAAGGPKSRPPIRRSHRDDVGLHYSRPGGDVADRPAGWPHGDVGGKPLFLAGFAILPIRAVLYTLSDNSFWLIGVQVLDGVGAGIFGADQG